MFTERVYFPIIKFLLYAFPLLILFIGIYAIFWPIEAIAKAVNAILVAVTMLIIFPIFFGMVFGVKRDSSGRPRGKGVWIPGWLFSFIFLFSIMLTFVITIFVWEPISPIIAREIAVNMKASGIPIALGGFVSLLIVIFLDFHSAMSKRRRF